MGKQARPDDENPEWTTSDFRRARPTAEVLGGDVAFALTRKPRLTVGQAMASQSALLVQGRLAA